MWKLNLTVVTIAVFVAQFTDNVRGGVVGDCIAIEFVSTGCNQCLAMDTATQQALAEGWVVRRVNVQQEPHLAQRWRIHTTPTTLLVRGTREIDRILGPVDYMELSRRMVAASNPDKLKSGPDMKSSPATAALASNNRSIPSPVYARAQRPVAKLKMGDQMWDQGRRRGRRRLWRGELGESLEHTLHVRLLPDPYGQACLHRPLHRRVYHPRRQHLLLAPLWGSRLAPLRLLRVDVTTCG